MIIISKAQLQKIWSNTYKSLPFVSKKEDERRHFIPSRVGVHTYPLKGASVLKDGEEKERQSD